ncbi:hypothetical protein FGO68_gene6396 [Halteria grandinella]|uniref:Uncharacterized protein n=1 Tax=Halteria grandinella TaxID=5974 RepID=A0A8J8SWY7_HALGN|nr:hypothetical protein FGO68_gene6396 [Halteria grandinella]
MSMIQLKAQILRENFGSNEQSRLQKGKQSNYSNQIFNYDSDLKKYLKIEENNRREAIRIKKLHHSQILKQYLLQHSGMSIHLRQLIIRDTYVLQRISGYSLREGLQHRLDTNSRNLKYCPMLKAKIERMEGLEIIDEGSVSFATAETTWPNKLVYHGLGINQ